MNAQMTIEDLIKPRTQTERILAALRSAGTQGLTNRQLADTICLRYSARIAELREDGYDIQTVQLKRGLFKFVLVF